MENNCSQVRKNGARDTTVIYVGSLVFPCRGMRINRFIQRRLIRSIGLSKEDEDKE